jgi:hypothetical protein
MRVLSLSQAGQDVFARHVVGRAGTYLDIGSFRPTYHNNSRTLELEGWKGLSIDYQDFSEEFKQKRSNPFLYGDVTTINWEDTIERYPFLKGPIDYISFDVDGATRAAFDLFPFNKIRFAAMTIEHDQYRFGTELRDYLRSKLTSLGYVLICADVVMPDGPGPNEKYGAFEDWWVNPALVDMDRLESIRSNNITYLEIFKKIDPAPYAFYCPPPSYE